MAKQTGTKRGKSAEELQAERRALTARFAEWLDDVDDAQRAAMFALFDGYSERNAMLIAMQDPDATDVDGYREWQKRGRQVRKGETGIRILAPAGFGASQTDEATGEETPGRPLFRLASVFDVRQTDLVEVEG